MTYAVHPIMQITESQTYTTKKMQLLLVIVIISHGVVAMLAKPATSDAVITNATAGIQLRPDCQTNCGNVTIPYPFGIGLGKGCSIHESFDVTCNTSYDPPRAFLGKRENDIQILGIWPTQLRIANSVAESCYEYGKPTDDTYNAIKILPQGTTFSYSNENVFTLVGCDDFGFVSGSDDDDFISGCSSQTHNLKNVPTNECLGVCCCQVSIKPLKRYSISIKSFNNHTTVSSFNNCSFGFLGEKSSYTFRGYEDLFYEHKFPKRLRTSVPIVLDWVIGNQTCDEARNNSDFACAFNNTKCIDSNSSFRGYHCSCSQGYEGYPYLSPGCYDINECEDRSKNDCEQRKYCHNTPGGYNCYCPHGYKGDGKKHGRGCMAQFPLVKVSLVTGFAFLTIIIGISWLYFAIKRRKNTLLKEKFFRENGGMLLRQKSTTSSEGSVEHTREFTIEELKKATNNFDEDRIIGHGGYGIVYKGILVDHRVVAIKKSRVMDKSQIEQFINEVVILTKINHRNVVKLLGCCLESEVPVLVYEFVSNGSLYEHIHNDKGLTWLSFDNRLRIAAESAGALAYLHSAASMPIIHRDVKSPNILLDDLHVTKISDFGASRLVPLDQTQVTTLVQGTLGYLDPEYFQTGQLTDKSDVYSFGVVLAELLTGRKPLCTEGPLEEKNLATHFIMSFKENQLFRILDTRVKREGTLDQLQTIAQLVKRCLHLSGDKRPTMKEVAMELEGLRKRNRLNDQHALQDQLTRLIKNEVEPSDLYSIQLGSYATPGETSEQFSPGTSHLLLSLNSSR